MTFRIDSLPGKYGDCLWIEYGIENDLHRILIDGGTASTKDHIISKIRALPEDQRFFDLVVITHLDKDHIEGILSLLNVDKLDFKIKDIWFNAYKHLQDQNKLEEYSSKQGEKLSSNIIRHKLPWNNAFNSMAVVLSEAGLPVVTLDGGMKLTLLSPNQKNLCDLRPIWEEELIKSNIVPGYGENENLNTDLMDIFSHNQLDINELNDQPFKSDESKANASSIAFIAELNDKSILFAGDALPSVILNSLNSICPDKKIKIDLFKVSHHASAGNTSPELIEKLDCKKFLISTNGSIYHHPAPVTIARLIKCSTKNPEFYFNYKSEYNKKWGDKNLQYIHEYQTYYPEDEGISIHM